jgi:hypothetical protein
MFSYQKKFFIILKFINKRFGCSNASMGITAVLEQLNMLMAIAL